MNTKTKNGWTLVEILVAVAVLGMLAALLLTARARAAEMVVNGRALSQDATAGWLPVDSALTGATNTTVKSSASTPIAIPPNVDLAFWVSGAGVSGTETNAVTYRCETSPDSNVWTTTGPVSASLNLNGTNAVTNYVFVSRTNLYGAQYLRWSQTSTTATNGTKNGAIYYRYLSP